MKRRKLLYIIGTLNSGGIERTVTESCLSLKDNEAWEPMVCCILKKEGAFLKELEDADIQVVECKLSQGIFSFIKSMRNLLKKYNIEVVHSHVAFSLLWQTMAYKLGNVTKIVFTQQNEYQNWNSWIAKWRLRTYYYISKRYITTYTCISERVRKSLARLLNEEEKTFPIIWNGYDDNKFYPRPELKAAIRKEFQVENNEFLICVVARFALQKGHPCLIRACKLLQEEKLKFKVILVGTGPEMAPSKQLIQELGLNEQFIFLGNRSDVHLLLNGMDCFVLPSLWEGFGIVLVEAMATGIPVIGTKPTGMEEIIEHDVNGLLVNSGNISELKDAMLQIAKSPAFAEELAIMGSTIAKLKFSFHQIMSRYLEIYN